MTFRPWVGLATQDIEERSYLRLAPDSARNMPRSAALPRIARFPGAYPDRSCVLAPIPHVSGNRVPETSLREQGQAALVSLDWFCRKQFWKSVWGKPRCVPAAFRGKPASGFQLFLPLSADIGGRRRVRDRRACKGSLGLWLGLERALRPSRS